MCVVAFAIDAHPRWRLVLAGNRDEFHARPTAALARWDDGSGIVAGRDLEAGGTWLGVDARGRCALVTNVRDFRQPQTGLSRGLLASDYLRGRGDARDHAQALLGDAGRYRPFNLLLVDPRGCAWVGNRPRVRTTAPSSGVHVLSNAELDTPWPKATALGQRLRTWLDEGGDTDFAALFDALADDTTHADAQLPDTGIGLERERWLSAAFIRGEDYGTRASTVVALGHDGNGTIIERRWGPMGVALGETRLAVGPAAG
ncbi:NRDE family protein [Pseudoxanthomonas daejeonensis]|uniref:NRDE family protein n=1 Tax=Pseudoxanthomonas daejeonensis TaxID=266062 RepID=UPI001F54717C|nr:NRDE family protein [Pseudoxanthomonas daejeonensis]UNK58815.1 NRDE family protein [Pseudoxanthomonas daejeonensis]